MSAHLTDELAQSLVDALLPEADLARWQAHAAGCVECRALVESYRVLGDALGDLDTGLPPPDFTRGVMAAIEVRESSRAWERRLALGILSATACVAALLLGAAGASAWAPALSRLANGLGDLATALAVGTDVLSPIVRVLRVQIAIGCAAAGLPVLFALSRLVPRRARVTVSAPTQA